MSNINLTTTIVRLSFAKGSNEIYVGKTKNNNFTFVGEIVYSEDLTVSHYNKLFDVDGSTCVGSVGTICIADNEKTNALIQVIESIQAARPVNARGNKYPFVFLRVVTNGTIIFNKGVNGEKHRLTFLDVELIEVEADAPDEVVELKSPQLTRNLSNYGTVRYRRKTNENIPNTAIASPSSRRLEAQTKVAVDSANIANEVPSFNTKTIETEPHIEEITPQVERPSPHSSGRMTEALGEQSQNSSNSLNSQQDKLNAIAVAMKAAGMSGIEIAQALKEEMSLV